MSVHYGRCSIDEFSAEIILVLVISIARMWCRMICLHKTVVLYYRNVKWKFLQQIKINLLFNFVQSVVVM